MGIEVYTFQYPKDGACKNAILLYCFFAINIIVFHMAKNARFEWDEQKNKENIQKHGVSFYVAQYAFADSKRVILEDLKHGQHEKRYYCLGNVNGGIITVRFTWRKDVIRIFGAGYWRKGRKIYEEENHLHE